ncbi:MAG: TusE/DsrC/DsvC family sulfur relay protein [Thiohalocapsa sp.]|uniref:TusE/DsrC/DsvC family sulfur relay protein n=1 Tax=Thiohalocapsa sp. TaxID=2497641 RepID=UPI0025DA1C89|nr:TusE/DsrC/DsvC family sulfur relay protein [Thiohalocapsa sp.]MCG6940667.1 TusE/DsrC/DsvC family sulfur relay protein [Thiohalocapsa sp.]
MADTMQEILNPGANAQNPDFPNAPADWTRASAEASAEAEDMNLTDDHWAVIRALQHFFAGDETPSVRAIHDALNERFHAKGGLKYLYEIFPGGPVAQGCRLAGVQAPAGAVDPSFGSVQ